MKSLLTYINESCFTTHRFIKESSSKYINKLRKFLEPAYKNDPNTFIDPDVFYPSGIGKIEDLALIQFRM